MRSHPHQLACMALTTALVCFASAADAKEAQEPPRPTDFAIRLTLPAVGVTTAFNNEQVHPAALIAWPFQYPLDDLMVAHFRVILEPQVVIPPTETIAFRFRLGLRWVPVLHGLLDETPRLFIGAGASFSSKIAASGEIGVRLPFQWPKWTFFIAARYDRRFAGDVRNEAALLGGFTFF